MRVKYCLPSGVTCVSPILSMFSKGRDLTICMPFSKDMVRLDGNVPRFDIRTKTLALASMLEKQVESGSMLDLTVEEVISQCEYINFISNGEVIDISKGGKKYDLLF